MSELVIPPWIIPESETHEWLDEGTSVFRAAFAPGLAQRQSYGGLRLKLSRRHTVRAEEKAQLLTILKATRGAYQAIRTKVHFANRGSGIGTEVLSNSAFQNGTTSWTSASEMSISVSDRILRSARTAFTSAGAVLQMSAAATVTANVPYLSRFAVHAGRGGYSSGFKAWNQTDSVTGPVQTGFGLKYASFVPQTTSLRCYLSDNETSGVMAGDYLAIPYASLARCAQVDNGQNLCLRSDEFDNAAWNKFSSSVGGNLVLAPDGTTTGDSLVENSATAAHGVESASGISIASSAADYCFCVALKAGSRTWVRIGMSEATGSTYATAYFNLSTGAVGTTAVGANWSNIRTVSVSLGNDWYYCCIVARKTNAATSLGADIRLATADNTFNYLGNGTGNALLWRATLSQSSVPSRLAQTTDAAISGTSQSGSGIHIKGLSASTNGILFAGDWFEVNGELKQASTSLNSDAAGIGYLAFEPSLVRSPANDEPVVFTEPMGRFLVSNLQVDNEFGTQARVSYDLEHIYE